MMKSIGRRGLAIHLIAVGALAIATVLIDFARNIPRVFPASDQRILPVLLGLLVLAIPVSAWQCRRRIEDLKVVLGAYGVAVAVLSIEVAFARSVFRGCMIRAALQRLAIGVAYGVLEVCIVRLAARRLWLAATALLLFAGTGMADLCRANSYRGNIHWIVRWTV